jgi:hypothetical protein
MRYLHEAALQLIGERAKGTPRLPYLPVNEVAMDDDDPSAVIALLCVSEGNHPFGRVVRMRSADWRWEAGK